MLTNKGRLLFAKMLAGNLPTGDPYCELGTDDTPPDRTDEDLYAGYFRKVASVSYEHNILYFECQFDGSEGTPPSGEIQEVAFFWDNADGTLGTGEMFARMLVIPGRPKPAGSIFVVKWQAYIGQCEFLETPVVPPVPPTGENRIGEARIGEGEIE